MTEALVTGADVEAALLRPLTETEVTYFRKMAAHAESQLRTALPSLDRRVAAWAQEPRPGNAIDPGTVAAVLAGVLKRALVNPKGLWSSTETTGPFSRSETFPGVRGGLGAGEGSGGIVVTASDVARLTRARSGVPRSARLRPAMAPPNVPGSRFADPC